MAISVMKGNGWNWRLDYFESSSNTRYFLLDSTWNISNIQVLLMLLLSFCLFHKSIQYEDFLETPLYADKGEILLALLCVQSTTRV